MSAAVFEDRRDAGRQLAERLLARRGQPAIVLALPRGGVPVAAVIAEQLRAPLDVFVVRKVGAPGNPEYALGAIAEGQPPFLDPNRLRELGLRRPDLTPIIEAEQREVERRVELYRNGRALPSVRGRVVILVDDGLATGATALAAVRALRRRGAAWLILAVGVASVEAAEQLSAEVDELVCPRVPPYFDAVGSWYRDFSPVEDDEVLALLRRHRPPTVATGAAG
ncbi:MAG TPA: phosphoribosyltransferase family protein [Thermoplasmata archaeon]|nr:phosphoribosyltransferase family protein [Thermoplasmata archaeon]